VVLTSMPFIAVLFVVTWFYYIKDRKKATKTAAQT